MQLLKLSPSVSIEDVSSPPEEDIVHCEYSDESVVDLCTNDVSPEHYSNDDSYQEEPPAAQSGPATYVFVHAAEVVLQDLVANGCNDHRARSTRLYDVLSTHPVW